MIGQMPEGKTSDIVKVQKPLFTSEPEAPMALVYNEDRSLNVMVPYTEDLERLFGDDMKQYWLADWSGGEVELLKEVGEQDW